MLLNERDIQEIKAIHLEEFHENISDKEAEEIGSRLLRLYQILVQPLPSERSSDRNVNNDEPAIKN